MPQAITAAATSIGQHFDGGFWTGTSPPVNYSFWPFTAVIDMEDGTVIAMDTQTSFLSTSQIISAIQQANSD